MEAKERCDRCRGSLAGREPSAPVTVFDDDGASGLVVSQYADCSRILLIRDEDQYACLLYCGECAADLLTSLNLGVQSADYGSSGVGGQESEVRNREFKIEPYPGTKANNVRHSVRTLKEIRRKIDDLRNREKLEERAIARLTAGWSDYFVVEGELVQVSHHGRALVSIDPIDRIEDLPDQPPPDPVGEEIDEVMGNPGVGSEV